ncbi:hypothetical protein ABENE_20775 [Asticcacaulis benevestitus DSM 16100 = ATCC BAA-896]|uniref:Uncharacterized protein n=1 Tax=Asticcacaulis benevestitus DSM 16100 = ATCC BAA-896 TaxID=1121022 RepID=V4NLV1_9CAUL|nr:hypothetical protein ABENE_20775 [Asticcacaulis benevestitus DSM 16100 = ATCC BAA-896]
MAHSPNGWGGFRARAAVIWHRDLFGPVLACGDLAARFHGDSENKRAVVKPGLIDVLAEVVDLDEYTSLRVPSLFKSA